MPMKSTTTVTSAFFAPLRNHKGQRQFLFIATAVATLILWKLHSGTSPGKRHQETASQIETHTSDQKMVGMKWSYDELAHKLIVENTDLAYVEISEGFTKGIGRALNTVAKQNAGKPVLVNL